LLPGVRPIEGLPRVKSGENDQGDRGKPEKEKIFKILIEMSEILTYSYFQKG
jgi:hypothetical protein